MVDRDRLPVFDDVLGRPRTIIHAYTAAEIGLPLVELRIDGQLTNLTISQAKRIGDGLMRAAAAADACKGEAPKQ